jgi:predicted Holliday junction resolvase-like endonuclease
MVDGVPNGLIGLILGQFGALVICLVIIWHDLKKVIPELKEDNKALQAKLDEKDKEETALREKHSMAKEEMRTQLQAEEKEREEQASKWRSRHMKEKGLRTWYQSRFEALWNQHNDKDPAPRPPTDIEKTHYEEG